METSTMFTKHAARFDKYSKSSYDEKDSINNAVRKSALSKSPRKDSGIVMMSNWMKPMQSDVQLVCYWHTNMPCGLLNRSTRFKTILERWACFL